MAIEFQPTQFQPVSFYDLPTLAFSQVMEGEFTTPGFFSGVSEATGIGSATLTPIERESLVDKAKQKHGLTGLSGAMADIATNPWVWFAFLTTPAAVSALRKGVGAAKKGVSRGIFNISPEYHAFTRKNKPWLVGWRLFTASQAFRGTQLHPVAMEIAKARALQLQFMEESLSPATDVVLANLNKAGIRVKSLDPNKAPLRHRDTIRDLDNAIDGRLSGKDRVTEQSVTVLSREMGEWEVTIMKDGEEVTKKVKGMSRDDMERALTQTGEIGEGSSLQKVKKISSPSVSLREEAASTEPIMSPKAVTRILNKWGARPLVEAKREWLNEMGKRQFLREDLLANVSPSELNKIYKDKDLLEKYVDTDKVVNLWKSAEQRSVQNARGLEMDQRSAETTGDLFSVAESQGDNPALRTIREVMNLVDREGRMIPLHEAAPGASKEVRGIISKILSSNMSGGKYFPKLYDSVDETGRSILRKAVKSSGKKTVDQAIAAGHVMPRNNREGFGKYSLDDIESLKRLSGGNRTILRQLGRSERSIKRLAKNPQNEGMVTVQRLGSHDATKFYGANSANTYATFLHGNKIVGVDDLGNPIRKYVSEVWDPVNLAQKGSQRHYDSNKVSKAAGDSLIYKRSVSPAKNRDVLSELPTKMGPYGGGPGRGYYSLGDALNQTYNSVREPGLRGIIKDVIVPQMLGKQTIQHSTENLMAHTTAMAARSTANLLKNMGVDKTSFGEKVVKKLDAFHDSPMSFIGSGTSGGLARYLYVTHLGFNPASVVLNLSQPWLLGATQLGVGPVIKGYGKAFKEMGNYFSRRMEMKKVFLNDAEHAKLIKDSFEHAEHLGISPDMFRNLDDLIQSSDRSKAGIWDKFSEAGMKVFEKAEWMNRLVVSHAIDDVYRAAGRYKTSGPEHTQRLLDISQGIRESQFGADFLNTPFTFMGYGNLGKWFGRPEMRQFLTFPIRSVTGIAITSKQINEGRRQVMGFDVPWARTVDFMRGLGISSVLYYAGRNMFEADMSKALFYNSMTDIIGTDPFSDYENVTDFLPVPPVIDMGYDAVRGVTSADINLLSNSLWRMVPGGIAASRAFSSTPHYLGLPSDNPFSRLVGSFQKRYAAYEMTTPENQVPVFKGDGTFLEFRSPMQLVLQGLGLDLNASKVRSEETGYYVKQRELILGYRQSIISSLLANDIPGAMRKKAEYEKRLGIPFSVTKDQLRQFMRNRQVPRDERILDRIPPEARNMYAKFVAADMVNKDVDPSIFVDAPTSTARSRIMDRPQTFDVQADSIRELEQLVRETEERKKLDQQGFTNYSSFSR